MYGHLNVKFNKMHFTFLIYFNNLSSYIFRIQLLFIINRQLLYMQYMVFTMHLCCLAANTWSGTGTGFLSVKLQCKMKGATFC